MSLTAIERAIVDYLDAAGHDCARANSEWYFGGGEECEFSITALAIAVDAALKTAQGKPE